MSSLGDTLRFVLFLGAAYDAGTPEQRHRLRERVGPLLEGYRATGNEASIRAAVRDVMGPIWEPAEEWMW